VSSFSDSTSESEEETVSCKEIFRSDITQSHRLPRRHYAGGQSAVIVSDLAGKMAATRSAGYSEVNNLERMLRMRHWELIQLRRESDEINHACKILLKQWKNRDSQGKMITLKMDKITSKDKMDKITSKDKPSCSQTNTKVESLGDTTSAGNDVFDMRRVDEALAQARRARMIEKHVNKDSTKKPLQPSGAVTEPKVGGTGKSTSLSPCSRNTTTKKKPLLLASQIYGASQVKAMKTKRVSSSNAAKKSLQSSKGSRTHMTKPSKNTQSTSLKAQGNGVQVKSVASTLSQGSHSLPGSGICDQVCEGEIQGMNLLNEGRTQGMEQEKSSNLQETIIQDHFSTSRRQGDDQEKGNGNLGLFLISEHGQKLSMPSRYTRMRKAGRKVIAELELQGDVPSERTFGEQIERLDIKTGVFPSKEKQDEYISVLLFQKECEAFRELLSTTKAETVPKKKLSQETDKKEELTRLYHELQRMWDCVIRKEPMCRHSSFASPVTRESFVYSNVQEWEAYCKVKHEVVQLEWEVSYLKVCLEILKPSLKNMATLDK
jgi:hypothetical protein